MTKRRYGLKALAVMVVLMMLTAFMPAINVYADYENTHVNTGDQADDIASVAETQVGYKEGKNNSNVKYNYWFGKLVLTEGGSPTYNYAWCQTFVAWCANQAGIETSKVPKVSGTSSGMSFFIKNGTWHDGPGKGSSYTPKRGDIIYFYSTSSDSGYHVGIVTGCDGSTVYTVEGNSSDKVSECSYAVTSTKIYGYGVPNYKGAPEIKAPKVAKVTLDKSSYKPGENVTFKLSSDTGTTYTVGIDVENDDGTRTRIDTYDTSNTSYKRTFDTPGKYSCYITTYNEKGLADSPRIFFTICDTKPGYAKVSLEKNAFRAGENAAFHLSSDTGTVYTVGIDLEGSDGTKIRIDTYETSDNYYTRTFDIPGQYSCYITSYNEFGFADSERIYFSVYDNKPGYAKVELDQSAYKVGENVKFRLSSDMGNVYTVGIDLENSDGTRSRVDTYETSDNYYTRVFDTPGRYSCYITSYNELGFADSERIYFSVYDKKPGYVKVELDQR